MTMLAFLLLAAAPNPAPAIAPELQPLAFLVGSCWRGTFPGGQGVTDTHCFTPVFGGRYIRDVHVVAGASNPYRGETLYRWDAATRQIRFEYYASDGLVGGGNVVAGADGLRFPEQTYIEAGGGLMVARSSWTRAGDGVLVINEGEEKGAWREMWRMRWQRSGPAPAPEAGLQ